jgi:hypothetical protein
MPYHVTSDTDCSVSLSAVISWASANPTLVSPDPSMMSIDEQAIAGIISLSDYQSYAFSQIDAKVQSLLSAGFVFNGNTICCDSSAQTNLTSKTVAMLANVIVYPLLWDLGGGQSMSIPDQPTLMSFISSMNSFIQTTNNNGVNAKNNVKIATTPQGVETAYKSF